MIARSPYVLVLAAMLALLLPALYGNYLQLRKWSVKLGLEERLDHEKLTSLHIPTGEIVWHEPGKEIIYHAQLFDVEDLVICGDTSIVTGVFDADETLIEDALAQLTDSPEDNQLVGQIGQRICLSTAVIPAQCCFPAIASCLLITTFYSFPTGSVHPKISAVDSPPPDKVYA